MAKPNPNKNLQDVAGKNKKANDAALATLGGMDISQQDLTTMGVKNPAKYLKNLQEGKGPATRRMNLLQGISKPYQKGETQLTSALSGDIVNAENQVGAEVDLRSSEDPMIGQMQDYISQRLGVGLTPAEESAMRSELRAPVESAYQQAVTAAGTAGAAAGIAPGSGVSIGRGQQLAQQRQQGVSNVENQIVQEDLARKQQMEQEAAGQIGAEEGARAEDIGAQQRQFALQLQRLGQAESGMAGMAGLSEQQRQFDTTFAESQRQADLARQAWEKWAKSQQPSGFDIASGAIGGLVGGALG